MKLLNAARSAAPVLFALVLSACGGGGDESPPPPNLSKYQGTWTQECSDPIEFSPGVFGPGSTRSSMTISAPDGSGKVQVTLIVDFFDTTVACYDYATAPIATIRNSVPADGRPLRTEVGAGPVAGSLAWDVLGMTIPAQDLAGSGPSIRLETGAVPFWRVTFSDGKTDDTQQRESADSGEMGLHLATAYIFSVPTPVLYISGQNQYWAKK